MSNTYKMRVVSLFCYRFWAFLKNDNLIIKYYRRVAYNIVTLHPNCENISHS